MRSFREIDLFDQSSIYVYQQRYDNNRLSGYNHLFACYFLSYSHIRLNLRLVLFVNLRESQSSVVTESSITWKIVSISTTGSNDNERDIGNV